LLQLFLISGRVFFWSCCEFTTHQKPCPLADPSKRECDVDEHEDVGHGDGHDVAVGFALKLILKSEKQNIRKEKVLKLNMHTY